MRGRTVVLLLALTLLTVLVIVGIWAQMVPQYQARGEVRIRPIIPYLVFRTNDNGKIPFYESLANTQVAVVRSPQVLSRVLEQPDVRQTKWFREPKKSLTQRLFVRKHAEGQKRWREPPRSLMQWLTGQPDTPIERLKDGLSVEWRRKTEIVDVSFTCASAEDAATVVNAVLDQYMKYVNQVGGEQEDEEERARGRLYSQLKTEITDLETIVNKLHQELGTTTPQELISARRLHLDEMEARIAELARNIAIWESQVEQANILDGNEPANAPQEERLPYHADLIWDTLYSHIRTIRHHTIISRLDPNQPDMIELKKYVAFAEELLRQREALLDVRWRQPGAVIPTVVSAPSAPDLAQAPMSLKQQLAQARQVKKLLEEQYQKDKRDFENLLERAQEIERYNTTLRQKRELFDPVRRIREHKQIESRVSVSIQVLRRAIVPSEPLNDRRIAYTAIAVGLYLILGGCMMVFAGRRSGEEETPKDTSVV